MTDIINCTVQCKQCKEIFTIQITRNQMERYQANVEPVQHIFPELSAENRELFFLSNICGDCWNTIFPPEEE